MPKDAVGAEIGVFTGLFSNVIAEVCKPKQLFLVDPWNLLHGSHYPNWGAYTAHKRLPTHDAETATRARAEMMECRCDVIKAFSIEWLSSKPKESLDFVYLDAAHHFEAVLADLQAIHRVLKPGGVILGDDAWVKSRTEMSDVYQAVTEFSTEAGFRILHLDSVGQWAISSASQ
ncbi:MAG: class I SAM-dependent methyltransferase [Pseudomonadota bacterium]